MVRNSKEKEIMDKIRRASDLEVELVWLPKIMENQTNEEKDKLATTVNNGLGLNMRDAPFVTSIYNQVVSGKHLSFTQANILRIILVKYKKQYVRMMNNGKEEIQLRKV